MSRMRLQKDLFPYIQEKDPETVFTKNGVRRMALSGIIPYTEIAGRKLYNLDDVDDLLDNPGKLQARIEAAQQKDQCGKIRRISSTKEGGKAWITSTFTKIEVSGDVTANFSII